MNKRFQEMDILRGLAIIAVIIIHITSSTIDGAKNESTLNVVVFFNQLSRFAVPIFLILSGWGLTVSKKYKMGYLSFLKSQLSKIILYYVSWSVVYYLYTAESLSIVAMIKGMIFGTTYFHLYYVPLIIIFYIVYPFIYKYAKLNNFLLASFIVTILSQYAAVVTNIEIFNSALNIFNWLFYFVFGIWFANDFNTKVVIIKKHTRLLLSLFVVTASIVFAEAYITFDTLGKGVSTTSTRPTVMVLSIIFFMMIISFEWKNNLFKRAMLKISKVSYGMYLSHALILAVFKMLWNETGVSSGSILYMASALIVVTSTSYFASILMNNLEETIMSTTNRKLLEEQ
ncbi:acyltransferase [Alkalibacterium sp. f15]|uniref:acyltransferase n=1 Tax=Alkalibacterium sp. f15 TaxID=3414029 RepID=UPI003BF85AF2